MRSDPIGILDSGSGGLSIWQSITRLLPHESTVYIGDHQYIPYSEKPKSFIKKRVAALIRFLLTQKVKLIVIACNTATVVGIDYFRKKFPGIPIIGVVPVVKTAAKETKTKSFAVLSTVNTAKSKYQKDLIRAFAGDCYVLSLGNTELVKLIEQGKKDTPEMRTILRDLLLPVREKHIDVIAIGCTHFSFLRSIVETIIGKDVLILDSGGAVARQVKRILENESLTAQRSEKPFHEFYTTGNEVHVSKITSELLGSPLVVRSVKIA